ncbi:MAG: T9SS type A sorting domain-containing protein, partial [candidate division Zixibacteria bacterium]|nr:T9SS type A sorting domain-containing protein [candidate division Zixibacteria bacterium]
YTDVNRPLDTVYVEVWADNAGVPGTSIAGPWAVYPQSTLLDPQGWTYVDFRGLGVNVSGDFWLGYTYQDSFPVILGDSPAVTDRSMANTGAGWVAATTDYHIRAVVASGAPDTCMSCSVANYPSRVPREGGTIYWDMTVLNCGSVTVPTVYGEILPTNIDCNGPQYDFNLYKVIGSGLAPGGSFTNYYYFNPDPGTVPYPTFVEVALWSYVGPGPNNYYGACCFEFTFSTEWGRGGSADSWGSSGEWGIVGDGVLPGVTALGQCYPNPFNAATNIPFEIAKSGNVSIKVYNIAGQLVETLIDGSRNAGSHVAYWDASSYSSGVYYYSLETGNQKFVKRMAMIK